MNQPHDVQVVLSRDRKYPFHANTLARSSVFFANMLTEPSAARLSTRAKNAGITKRWLVELVEMPCLQYPAGQLELIVSLPDFDCTLCYPWTMYQELALMVLIDTFNRSLIPPASVRTVGLAAS